MECQPSESSVFDALRISKKESSDVTDDESTSEGAVDSNPFFSSIATHTHTCIQRERERERERERDGTKKLNKN
jgi:hypothetical protein